MPFTQLTHIYLYDEPDAPGLDIEQVGGFLAECLPAAEVLPRSDFFTHHFRRFGRDERTLLEGELLKQLARAQVTDLAEVAGAAGILGPDPDLPARVFISHALQAILRLLTPPDERDLDHAHVVFTESLLAHMPEDVPVLRLRALALGEPAVISTTGLIEALPRPREYQFRRAQMAMFALDEDALEDLAEEFSDRTFGYGDPRINEVCKGLALMACVYRATGEAFCEDPACRLAIPRGQEQLLATQCGPEAHLCPRHLNLLDRLARPPKQ
jgi:hypothetical protein